VALVVALVDVLAREARSLVALHADALVVVFLVDADRVVVTHVVSELTAVVFPFAGPVGLLGLSELALALGASDRVDAGGGAVAGVGLAILALVLVHTGVSFQHEARGTLARVTAFRVLTERSLVASQRRKLEAFVDVDALISVSSVSRVALAVASGASSLARGILTAVIIARDVLDASEAVSGVSCDALALV
jgi:hypothetical protein